jgi:riboflavin synthase
MYPTIQGDFVFLYKKTMFTGIIESLGRVRNLTQDQSNLHLEIESSLSAGFKIDQSVSHNGVCLTVIATTTETHTVTAIAETLQKTTLSTWKIGDLVNLEQCTQVGGRLDGHIVQGHVDQTAQCIHREERDGSWVFRFSFAAKDQHLIVEKGSITVNGISLTVVDVIDNTFSIAVIPYTFEHTNLQQVEIGDQINLEFDIIGKYVERMLHHRLPQ